MPVTQRNAQPSSVLEPWRGAVLAHTKPGDVRIALNETYKHMQSGLVFCGQPNREVRRDFGTLAGRVILDRGRWCDTVATPTDLFGLSGGTPPDNDSLLAATCDQTLSDVAASAPASVSLVLTPTGFIPPDQLDLISAVFDAVAACNDPRLIPLIPTHAQVLDPWMLERTCQVLQKARSPIALILADDAPQPFAALQRMDGLRTLLATVPDVLLLACEPSVALDATMHGACATAIGVNSGLRLPKPPPRTNGGPAAPRMWLHELWEHRSPKTYAKWYQGLDEPYCEFCSVQRSFASYGPGTPDRQASYRHTLHSWLGVLDDLAGLSSAEARSVLAEQRLQALDRHAELRPQDGLGEFDPVVRQLVVLDEGRLPHSLVQRLN